MDILPEEVNKDELFESLKGKAHDDGVLYQLFCQYEESDWTKEEFLLIVSHVMLDAKNKLEKEYEKCLNSSTQPLF